MIAKSGWNPGQEPIGMYKYPYLHYLHPSAMAMIEINEKGLSFVVMSLKSTTKFIDSTVVFHIDSGQILEVGTDWLSDRFEVFK